MIADFSTSVEEYEYRSQASAPLGRRLPPFCRRCPIQGEAQVIGGLASTPTPSAPPSIQPLLFVFELGGDVFFGEVFEVLGDHGLDFHLEAVGDHLLDLPLPGAVVLEPAVIGDLLGPLDVVLVKVNLVIDAQRAQFICRCGGFTDRSTGLPEEGSRKVIGPTTGWPNLKHRLQKNQRNIAVFIVIPLYQPHDLSGYRNPPT